MFNLYFKGFGKKQDDCERAAKLDKHLSHNQHASLAYSMFMLLIRSKIFSKQEAEEFASVEDNLAILEALTIMLLVEAEREGIVKLHLDNQSKEPGSVERKSQQTFGEKAVGIGFNPAKNPKVQQIKESYAKTIDYLENERRLIKSQPGKTMQEGRGNAERLRQLSIAITELQTSQMWAVKALTWVN